VVFQSLNLKVEVNNIKIVSMRLSLAMCKYGSILKVAGSVFRTNLIILTLLMISFSSIGQSNVQFTLNLKGGNLLPEANIEKYIGGQIKLLPDFNKKYFAVIQFDKIPSQEVQQKFVERKIQIVDYLTGSAYTIASELLPDFEFMKSHGVRSVFVLESKYKLDEGLLSGEIPAWAVKVNGYVDVSVIPFAWIEPEVLSERLNDFDAKVISGNESFRSFTIRVKEENLLALSNESWLQWMETIAPDPQDDNLPSKTLHRSNVLNDGYRNLTGAGVKIGIWDGGTVGPHKDFTGRLVLAESYSATDHGTHVAGTMAGAGLLDPYARGMSPGALIYSYDYNGSVNSEVAGAISTYGISMTQNSWGYGNSFVDCTLKDPYNSNSREQDINIYNNPTLVHVHSSGNSQSVCTGGWGTTTGKAAKNMLVVANVNSSDVLSGSSSCGPVRDGRIKPEISGLGTSVYSTLPDDNYTGGYSGTSMATPGVSGTIAQLVQRYRQLNGNVTPPASLMKAVACNTAKDLGNAGPDYKYGFGRINGVQAARALESNRYKIDSVSTGGTRAFSISVPSNTKRLRVMICWTDPAGAANSNPALINDLDLTVTDPSLTVWNPWILDATLPDNVATRDADHLNNIEQVTIDNPASGLYSLNVYGTSVPVGSNQVYSITWEVEDAYIEVTYPNGRDIFVPGSTQVIYWDNLGVTSNQTLQYSLNNGGSWTNISTTLSSTTTRYSWVVPSVVSSQALIRITSGALSDVSDSLFSIIGTPASLAISAGCVSGQVSVTWAAVANATHYDVFQLDEINGVWNVVGSNVTGTQHFVSGLSLASTYWFTVRARNNTSSVIGQRAIAQSVLVPNVSALTPYVIADGPLVLCPGDTLRLSGGDVVPDNYQVNSIPFQNYTPSSDIPVTLTDDAYTAALPIGFTFNYFGNPFTQFYISSNGLIGFSSASLSTYTPQVIPDPAVPNNLIALVWTDLNPSVGGTITYLTTGSAPNRKLVVCYNSVNRYGSANTVSGRIELSEGSDIIELFCEAISSGTNTMGLENSDGSVGIAVSGRNKVVWDVSVPEGIQFVPYNSTMIWQPGSIYSPTLEVTTAQNYSFSFIANGCTFYSDTLVVSACATAVDVQIKALIQGLYKGGGKLVNNINAGASDTLFLKLAGTVPPYSILYSDTAILDTNGTALFSFPSAVNGNSYYLVLQHRNSLETWSAAPLTLTSPLTSYDFRLNASSAFGSNLCNMGDGYFAIWSGDLDRNNSISITDINFFQSKLLQFLYGYYIGDLTGDNYTESADYSLLENNVPLMLQVAKP